MKDDIHIQILRWSYKNPGFTFGELIQNFPDHEKFLEREINLSENPIFQISKSGDSERSKEYILSFDGRLKLLDYEKLENARKDSKCAMKIAILSIAITFLALLSQIWHTRFYTESVNVVNSEQIDKSK